MSEEKASGDYRERAGHVVLLAVVVAVPALKLAWTLGGGDSARDALIAMGPGNWADILIGMFLNEALLATVLAVTVSRASYAHFAARGGALRHRDTPMAVTAATAAVVPLALGVVVGAFNGLGWGLATGLASYVVRVGVMVEYRTGRREYTTGRRTGKPAETVPQRGADALWIAGLLLGGIVLPAVAIIAALDGHSWTSVETCDVNTGSGTHRARLVELARQGNGIVGWDLADSEVVHGVNCAADANETIRPPWWRDA